MRKNAHDALEAYQEAIRLILSEDPQPTPLAWQRMRVNQAHNTLYNSLNQAMQEPAFNSHYLADMKLWVTHSQFIVEHINAMTTLAREHRALPPELAQEYLQSCEIAIQRCQQRLEYDEPGLLAMPISWMRRRCSRTKARQVRWSSIYSGLLVI